MQRSFLFGTASFATVLASSVGIITPSLAGPSSSSVVAGTASVTSGAGTVTINQSSNNAIINWQSFNVGASESVKFVQPGTSSTTLNRVTGGGGASTIDGNVTANGRIFIINPDGIVFGKGSKINVGGLVATTHDIQNQDFMAGKYVFSSAGNATASVVNDGQITASQGGFAVLVAPGARNSGAIAARLGTVALGSGGGFTLDFYGDQLLNLKVSGDVAGAVRDAETNASLSSNVFNGGTLRADGGTIIMTAATARAVVNSVINNTGSIQANSVDKTPGKIVLSAQTADTKSAGAPDQIVSVAGTISATGKSTGSAGGNIQITGEDIKLTGSTIDASGDAGGGKIRIGGDFGGGNSSAPAVAQFSQILESTAIPNATNVTADASTHIAASATTSGNGGSIVVWSNDGTKFAGTIAAHGGKNSGNGGFAEVSGSKTVDYSGLMANLSAPKGTPGTILFDPTSDTIDATKAASIEKSLNTGTNVSDSADDISITSSIFKTSGGDASLTLSVSDKLSVGDGVIIGSNAGKLNFIVSITPLYSSPNDFYSTLAKVYQGIVDSPAASAAAGVFFAQAMNSNQGKVFGFSLADFLNAIGPTLGTDVTSDPGYQALLSQSAKNNLSSASQSSLYRDHLSIGKNVQIYTNGGEANVSYSGVGWDNPVFWDLANSTSNSCLRVAGVQCGVSFQSGTPPVLYNYFPITVSGTQVALVYKVQTGLAAASTNSSALSSLQLSDTTGAAWSGLSASAVPPGLVTGAATGGGSSSSGGGDTGAGSSGNGGATGSGSSADINALLQALKAQSDAYPYSVMFFSTSSPSGGNVESLTVASNDAMVETDFGANTDIILINTTDEIVGDWKGFAADAVSYGLEKSVSKLASDVFDIIYSANSKSGQSGKEVLKEKAGDTAIQIVSILYKTDVLALKFGYTGAKTIYTIINSTYDLVKPKNGGQKNG